MIKKIKILLIILIILICVLNFSYSKDLNIKDPTKVVSIWKYEKLNPTEYLSKKIYYLHLNSDGTYIQYIELIPIENSHFKKVTLFTLEGKWYMKQKRLILVEYDKKNEIDMNYLYQL